MCFTIFRKKHKTIHTTLLAVKRNIHNISSQIRSIKFNYISIERVANVILL